MDYLEHAEILTAFQARADTSLDKTLRKYRAEKYPRYAIYLVVCLIFVITLYNVASFLYTLVVLRSPLQSKYAGGGECKDKEMGSTRRLRHIHWRRMPQALLNAVRIAAYRVTLPVGPGIRLPLTEVVTCLGYLLAILTFEFANTRSVIGLLDAQYWANRAGTLAVSQFAIIVAMSGKNNIVSTLTGIGYEKLNILHRAASRTILILVWVHMWGRWDLGLTGKDSLHVGWMRSGVVAAVALTLLVILGTRQLRNWRYEVFLIGHIVLVLIVLVAGCIHVTNARQFLPYVWSACIFWGFDRVLRLALTLRIRYLSSRCAGTPARATLEVLSTDSVRVSLRVTRSSNLLLKFGWRPGQSAYLSVPAIARWGLSTEAHPFTIASIDAPAIVPGSSDATKDTRGNQEVQGKESELEMKFIIRVRRGFTRRLHEHAVRSGGVCSVSAFVDGPYGEPPVVYDYPNVVLVAGGSGASFTLPLLLDVVRRAQKAEPDTLCRKTVFIWFIRERVHFEAISHDLRTIQERLPDSLEVEIRIYVTGGLDSRAALSVPSLDSSSGNGNDAGMRTDFAEASAAVSKERLESELPTPVDEKPGSDTDVTDIGPGRLLYGRPEVSGLLKDEIAACEDSVAVCVSGPQTLIDDVRDTLSRPSVAGPMAVLRGGASVFLHVERFGL